MHIKRELTDNLIEAAREYPVVAVVGPRQSGKTTLTQTVFPGHAYISLEDFDVRERAKTDPRAFLQELPSANGIVLDEIQHVPELLSYMQTIVDREKKKGFFIVTGSQNFLVDEAITQTLAGRMAVLTLLPLSLSELKGASLLPDKVETLLYKGFYPKAHAENVNIERLYSNYIRLYVERDVRQIKNVADLNVFQKFMRLCAGRIGQLLNVTSLSGDCGVNIATVNAWLSLLQASYVIVLLQPYYQNFGRRLIKAPKLYFLDTGVACSLLKIRSAQELSEHYLRGGLFESLIITDFLKQQYNLEQQPNVYFWRDAAGHELDCIIDDVRYPIPVEIKSGQTIATDFFKELNFWHEKAEKAENAPGYLIYGGSEGQTRSQVQVIGWKSAGSLIRNLSLNSKI